MGVDYSSAEKADPRLSSDKLREVGVNELNQEIVDGQVVTISSQYWGLLGRWSRKLDSYGVEARGIQRVLPEERSPQSYWGLCLLWASSGLTIGNFTTGSLANFYYNLTFAEAAGIIWAFGALGSAVSAYCAIFGKRNGLRALVNSRYVFGYYGAMIMSALNILTEVVFGVLACILGGETLHTLSKGHLPTSWGIVIVGVVSWLIASGGFKYVHYYERFAFIPPMIVFISLYAVGGKHFTNARPEPDIDSQTHSGNVLTFGAIIFGSSSGWIPVAADYYIYFPEKTPSWRIFMISFLGIWVIPSFAITCGAGFASTLQTKANWAAAFEDSSGTSADFIEIAFRHLGNVRYFFLFILAWSMINNNIFNYYSISISMQLFGAWSVKVPRFFYTILALVVMIIISVLGRNNLHDILSDLIAIIGYWSIIYFVIYIEEHLIFRQPYLTRWLGDASGIGWDLNVWNDRRKLPFGLAANFAFCVGIAGAVVGMGQVWYVGPIAKKVGAYGADLGIELAFLFSGIVFPPLRYLELKRFGK